MKIVLCQIVVLALLSVLQPGKLQEAPNDAGLASVFDEIKSLLSCIKDNTTELIREFHDFRRQVERDVAGLNQRLESVNHTIHSKLDASECSSQEMMECPREELYTCGGTGGWRRAVYLDMTDPSTTCPSGWQLTGYSKRTCGRVSTGGLSCDSVTFPVSGGQYSEVCGRIKAYQKGATLAFYSYVYNSAVTSIDGAYATGFSLTHGDPREHIWTFAAGISEPQYGSGVSTCPCGTNNFAYWNSRVPPFVGNDYFCESGLNAAWSSGYSNRLFPDDPLWDGENCPTGTCCSFSDPPFFSKTLDSSTSDDLELRLCNHHTSRYSDVPVELIELYVK